MCTYTHTHTRISKNHENEEEIGFPSEGAGFDLGFNVNHQRKGFHTEEVARAVAGYICHAVRTLVVCKGWKIGGDQGTDEETKSGVADKP